MSIAPRKRLQKVARLLTEPPFLKKRSEHSLIKTDAPCKHGGNSCNLQRYKSRAMSGVAIVATQLSAIPVSTSHQISEKTLEMPARAGFEPDVYNEFRYDVLNFIRSAVVSTKVSIFVSAGLLMGGEVLLQQVYREQHLASPPLRTKIRT